MKRTSHLVWSIGLAFALILAANNQAQAATCQAWAPNTLYTAGTVVTYNGSTYTATVTQDDYSGTGWNPTVASLWSPGGSCSSGPTPTPTPKGSPTSTPKGTATPTPKTTPKPTATPTAKATPTPSWTSDGSVWMGHHWNITNGGMAGQAPGSPSNVSVDSNGYLHLNITNRSGSWTAAEMFSADNMGFGTYQWVIQGNIWNMDPTTVLGLFPYGPANGIGVDGENEIDIEFSKWDNTCGFPCNADFTVYPSTGNRLSQGAPEWEDDFQISGGSVTTTRMVWSSNSIVFTIMSGAQPIGTTANVLKTDTYTGNTTSLPQSPSPVGMNLWCFNGTPSSNQSVVIQSFEYVP